MDYHTLTEGDRVKLSAGPIDYQVDHVSSDRIVLTPDDPEEPMMEIVKDRGEWTLVNVNKINFQVTVVNPLLPTSDLNLAYILLNELDLEDLINLCQTDNRLLGICQSSDYWKNRLSTKFGKTMEGIFLSGPERQPILEGDHSVNEYIDVERRINDILDIIGSDDYENHVVQMKEDIYEGMYEKVDEFMYILRLTENERNLPLMISDHGLLNVLSLAITSRNYPIEYMEEYISYISRGFVDEEVFCEFANNSKDEYLEIWKVILDNINFSDVFVRCLSEATPRLIELFESYGYH